MGGESREGHVIFSFYNLYKQDIERFLMNMLNRF